MLEFCRRNRVANEGQAHRLASPLALQSFPRLALRRVLYWLKEKLQTAGSLCSTGITPLHRYCGPFRHPLAFDRFPRLCRLYDLPCSGDFSPGRVGTDDTQRALHNVAAAVNAGQPFPRAIFGAGPKDRP
jgi:hypothetical protein